MAVPTNEISFHAVPNNGGVDLSIEFGNHAVMRLRLNRDELEDMVQTINSALGDEDSDDDFGLSDEN